MENGSFIKKEEIKVGSQMPKLESAESENKDCQITQVEEPISLISFEAIESPPRIEITRQPSPPPVLAEVQDLIPTTSPPVTDADCRLDNSSSDGLVCAEAPLELHIVRISRLCCFVFPLVSFPILHHFFYLGFLVVPFK